MTGIRKEKGSDMTTQCRRRDVKKHLNISLKTFDRLRKTGKLKKGYHYNKIGGSLFIDIAKVEEYFLCPKESGESVAPQLRSALPLTKRAIGSGLNAIQTPTMTLPSLRCG